MTQPIRPSEDIKRRLRAGEPLTSAQVAAEYGVSGSLLSTVIRGEQEAGFIFDAAAQATPGTPRVYTVTHQPDGQPVQPGVWGKADGVVSLQSNRKKKATEPKPEPKKRAKKGLPHPVPQIGDSLDVYLLLMTEDGDMHIGLRNGAGTWVVNVAGYTKAVVDGGN